MQVECVAGEESPDVGQQGPGLGGGAKACRNPNLMDPPLVGGALHSLRAFSEVEGHRVGERSESTKGIYQASR
jgi:hypothetical protein